MKNRRFSSKLENIENSLTYNDVLVKPNFSSVLPENIDLSLQLNKNLKLEIPIFSAAMDTITEYDMARAMIKNGGCGPLHRNAPISYICNSLKKLSKEFGSSKPLAVTVGVTNTQEEIQEVIQAGANILVVDSAHAHSENVGNLVKYISDTYPDIFLIAGNIVTAEGAKYLVDRGAKAIKVGIGPGSICTTRKVTGVGRGQLNSISEVADFNKENNIITIADGGIVSSDDIVKAIAVGADAVMLGFMLSGTTECPGKYFKFDGKNYKLYRGMGSIGAMKLGSASRYNKHSDQVVKLVPEGIESYSADKGSVVEVLKVIEWSLRSAFGYIGAKNISEAQNKTDLVKISREVRKKSNFHSVDHVVSTE